MARLTVMSVKQDVEVSLAPSRPARGIGRDEFSAAIRDLHEPLARLAFRLCGDASGAEDAVAEAFARTWPQWRRGRVEDLAPYLRRAVVNQVHGGHRRLRRERETPRDTEGSAGFEDHVHDHAVLWAALGHLAAGQRAVVVLRVVEDLSEEETARLLDVLSSVPRR